MSEDFDQELQDFYSDICEVVEEHGDNTEEMAELIDSLGEFRESWMDTYSVTGLLWLTPPEMTQEDTK